MPWLTAEQALQALKTKPQTLYANVSRGRIRAKPDPADPRRSLYQAADVQRLAERHAGRRKAETVAAETIRWGDPVLSSAIATIIAGRLFYRGEDATDFAEAATLEQTAALLWNGAATLFSSTGSGSAPPSIQAAFLALAGRVTADLPALGRSQVALRREAHGVVSTIADALAAGPADQPLHLRLAASWDRPDAADCLRRALVLLADHELNASTFAARVTASAGAALSAAVLSGLATLTGPLHGAAWQRVNALIESSSALGAEQAIRRSLVQGNHLAAFGHPLYPDGDIRLWRCFRTFPCRRNLPSFEKRARRWSARRSMSISRLPPWPPPSVCLERRRSSFFRLPVPSAGSRMRWSRSRAES